MNKFKLRIYYEGELVALWIVNEKQKKVIEELAKQELFYEEVRFEFLGEESIKNLLMPNFTYSLH